MKRFNSILCVVDPEKAFDTVITQSLRIANDNQADITFVSVIETGSLWRHPKCEKKEFSKNINNLIEIRRAVIELGISNVAPSVTPNIEIYSGIGLYPSGDLHLGQCDIPG